jgi:hypothetical protein
MKVRVGYTIEHNGRLYSGGDTIPLSILEEVKKKASWRLEDEEKKFSPNRKTSEKETEKREEKEITEDIINRSMTKEKVRTK